MFATTAWLPSYLTFDPSRLSSSETTTTTDAVTPTPPAGADTTTVPVSTTGEDEERLTAGLTVSFVPACPLAPALTPSVPSSPLQQPPLLHRTACATLTTACVGGRTTPALPSTGPCTPTVSLWMLRDSPSPCGFRLFAGIIISTFF